MIYIVWAAPRKGKTYYATKWAIDTLRKISRKKSNKSKVFSNYPIWHPKFGSTLLWEKGTYQYDVMDSLIIIDEAYRDYNSRQYHQFSKDEHTFFATNGHNNNDIVLIAHGIHRIDSVIREMVDQYFFVKKYTLPFSEKPLFFIVEGYLDEIDIANRYRRDAVYSKQFIPFNMSIANCYNTHYFRKAPVETVEYINWKDYYQDNMYKEENV